jgi:hypothetical protein
LSGGPVSGEVSGASRRMGEGNENLVYSSPWDFKGSLTCHKVLRHGIFGFTFHPKEVVLRIFIALKNILPCLFSNPSSNHTNHYTTKKIIYIGLYIILNILLQ